MDKKEIKEITELLEDADTVIAMIDGAVALNGRKGHLLAGLATIIHAIRVETSITDEDIRKAVDMALEDDLDDLEQKVDKLSDILKSLKELMTK